MPYDYFTQSLKRLSREPEKKIKSSGRQPFLYHFISMLLVECTMMCEWTSENILSTVKRNSSRESRETKVNPVSLHDWIYVPRIQINNPPAVFHIHIQSCDFYGITGPRVIFISNFKYFLSWSDFHFNVFYVFFSLIHFTPLFTVSSWNFDYSSKHTESRTTMLRRHARTRTKKKINKNRQTF